jgi:hypothetical protein
MIMTSIRKSYTQEDLNEVLQAFQQRSRITLTDEHYEIKERTDGNYFLIYLANPTATISLCLGHNANLQW